MQLILLLTLNVWARLSGFLYSPASGMFICRNDDGLRKDSIPLKFTIELIDPNANGKESKQGFLETNENIFVVLSVNGNYGRRNMLSIKKNGQAKLFRGKRCESVYHGQLVSEPCSKNPSQIFFWVPEDGFSTFVNVITNHYKKYYKGQESVINEYEDSKRKRKRSIAGEMQEESQSESAFKKSEEKEKNANDNKHAKNTDKNKEENADSSKNSARTRKDSTAEKEETASQRSKVEYKEQEELSKDIPLYRNLNYVSPKLRPRKRGIFAQGEDSSDMEEMKCTCKMECVKNPKNGICFYNQDKNGNLVPIMKDESCCEKEKKPPLCNYSNKIENLLCELNVKNSYGSFSKFLDKVLAER